MTTTTTTMETFRTALAEAAALDPGDPAATKEAEQGLLAMAKEVGMAASEVPARLADARRELRDRRLVEVDEDHAARWATLKKEGAQLDAQRRKLDEQKAAHDAAVKDLKDAHERAQEVRRLRAGFVESGRELQALPALYVPHFLARGFFFGAEDGFVAPGDANHAATFSYRRAEMADWHSRDFVKRVGVLTRTETVKSEIPGLIEQRPLKARDLGELVIVKYIAVAIMVPQA